MDVDVRIKLIVAIPYEMSLGSGSLRDPENRYHSLDGIHCEFHCALAGIGSPISQSSSSSSFLSRQTLPIIGGASAGGGGVEVS